MLCVDLLKLAGYVKWEQAADGEIYPHIHGPIPMSAVVSARPIYADSDGSFALHRWEKEMPLDHPFRVARSSREMVLS